MTHQPKLSLIYRQGLLVFCLMLMLTMTSWGWGRDRGSSLLYKPIATLAGEVCSKLPSRKAVLFIHLQELDGQVSYFNHYFSDQLQIALSNSVDLTVLNRQMLTDLYREREMTDPGLINDQTALTLGKIVGAKSIIFGTVMVLNKTISVTIKVADPEKGMLVSGLTYDIKKKRSIQALVESLNQKEEMDKTNSSRHVYELIMGEAIKKRIGYSLQKEKETQETKNQNMVLPVDQSDVWKNLKKSVGSE